MAQLNQRTAEASGKVIYTAKTRTTGGRENGSSRSSDGRLEIKLSPPGSPRARTVVCSRLVGLFRRRNRARGP